ncbi:helix-turn-helix domain-containing protein [Maritalea mobilis]|uniref:helix-turn-helix domain-containing protein n=1 Tax=Maritalea mobilis TaxID=483324 RepID=UPI001C963216|nr:helix-turn-helix domain-containing protein [Maritalea mobilis]MBY6203176.1 helix-turn-helix domain-containing protein [Maritalea mobilis]
MTKARGKRGKGHGGAHFVQLPEWVLVTPAWCSLSGNARALYIELKRRYKGSNNGSIRLSHRDAAELLNLHRNSVGRYYRELEDKGFIRMMEGHHLGPSGIGKTARWALDEYKTDTDGKPALKRFVQWRKY